MVIHAVIHLVCDRVCPEEYGPANSPEMGSQAWVCSRTGHAMGCRLVQQQSPTWQGMKFGKIRCSKDGVETSTAAALPEQRQQPWGAETGSWALGKGVPGWLRTSLLTGAHRANILQRLSQEKVQSCGVFLLLWLNCLTCYWRSLVLSVHLDYQKPQMVYFLLQTEEELNPVWKWSRDLVTLFLCLFIFRHQLLSSFLVQYHLYLWNIKCL